MQDDTESRLLDEISAQFGPSLLRTALRLTGNRDDAEDLVQDTYVRALGASSSFDGANAHAWVFTILHHTYASGKRHESAVARHEGAVARHPETVPTELATESAEEIITRAELSEEIEAALSALPPLSREAVLLADIKGLSCEEIAARMDCPVGTVMSRLHRGRHRIESYLEAAGAR